MTLQDFNKLKTEEAGLHLMSCCGSAKWVSVLMKEFPFVSEKSLVEKAVAAWYTVCSKEDWLEAFSHHPEIGDVKSLTEKLAGKEQAAVAVASKETIAALAGVNTSYKNKFGFIFIVCATGKSADEMLLMMAERLKNTRTEELSIAMGEQLKITLIRFKKLLDNANFQFLQMSQLTTHVLDTSVGRPVKNMAVKLLQQVSDNWQAITQGVTDADGRIADLLPPGKPLLPGNYKLVFETGEYFVANNIKGFYPKVEIQFTVSDEKHYHVPLLINPFGYSTYKGS